jgi:hypothetical protein
MRSSQSRSVWRPYGAREWAGAILALLIVAAVLVLVIANLRRDPVWPIVLIAGGLFLASLGGRLGSKPAQGRRRSLLGEWWERRRVRLTGDSASERGQEPPASSGTPQNAKSRRRRLNGYGPCCLQAPRASSSAITSRYKRTLSPIIRTRRALRARPRTSPIRTGSPLALLDRTLVGRLATRLDRPGPRRIRVHHASPATRASRTPGSVRSTNPEGVLYTRPVTSSYTAPASESSPITIKNTAP